MCAAEQLRCVPRKGLPVTNPSDPSSVARRYVEAIGEQDWQTVADC